MGRNDQKRTIVLYGLCEGFKMSKVINKEYVVYGFDDLQKNDELCEKIYQKFWLDNPENINPWADENLHSFETFADTLYMGLDFSLSNGECPERSCYIKLTPDYSLDNRDYKELLENYEGNSYCYCDDLKAFTLELLDKEEYQVLCEWSANDFVLEIQNKMLDLWFADNEYYLSKESFLDYVHSNNYKFDEDGNLF